MNWRIKPHNYGITYDEIIEISKIGAVVQKKNKQAESLILDMTLKIHEY